jgi:CubicO group peptidase (beta-lactamase class C family)
VYRIGSISKSFTALSLLALRDEGKLELDDPLAKWIPEAAQLVYPTRDARPLTLRQIASHTSGLSRMGAGFDFEAAPTEEAVVRTLPKMALESTPGTRSSYSNLGFGLLGIVVGRAAKQPFHDVVTAKILKPFGMTATAFDEAQVPKDRLAPPQPVPGAPAPKLARLGAVDGAGGIYSSVRDMAKYVAAQLAAYPARSDAEGEGIRRATLREAHSTGVPNNLEMQPKVAMISYGFGWAQEKTCQFDDIVTHGGAIDSYRSDIRFVPSRGVGFVFLTNFGNAATHKFTEGALEELRKTGALETRRAQPMPALVDAVNKLLGIYHQWDEAAFTKILARPIDPREKEELATYFKLHGKCSNPVPATIDTPAAGSFSLTCERGKLELQVITDPRGLIQGFFGRSSGVTLPANQKATLDAIVAIHNKWDDKAYAKRFTKFMPAPQMKKFITEFHAQQGTCKVTGSLHVGFDWGATVECSKGEKFDLLFGVADDANVNMIRFQQAAGTQPQCK